MVRPTAGASATAVLKAEHRVIWRVLAVLQHRVESYREEGTFEKAALQSCVEFFRLFADACHHAKEEDLLFPVLEQRGIPRAGGPIGVMLSEHQLARTHVREMQSALAALDQGDPEAESRFCSVADRYLELLRQHILKEDNVLFEMGDSVLSGGDQESLCASFCEAGCRSFDGKTCGQLELMADELEVEWSSG